MQSLTQWHTVACFVKTENWSGSAAKLQVETAQGLTIRVINNVSKRMEAKPRFHEAFQKEGCPDAFPYRQKVLNTALCRSLQKVLFKWHLGGGGGDRGGGVGGATGAVNNAL